MPLGLVSASSLNVLKTVLAPVSYDGSIVLMWNGMLEMREVRPFLMALTDLDLKPGIVYYFFT